MLSFFERYISIYLHNNSDSFSVHRVYSSKIKDKPGKSKISDIIHLCYHTCKCKKTRRYALTTVTEMFAKFPYRSSTGR